MTSLLYSLWSKSWLTFHIFTFLEFIHYSGRSHWLAHDPETTKSTTELNSSTSNWLLRVITHKMLEHLCWALNYYWGQKSYDNFWLESQLIEQPFLQRGNLLLFHLQTVRQLTAIGLSVFKPISREEGLNIISIITYFDKKSEWIFRGDQ